MRLNPILVSFAGLMACSICAARSLSYDGYLSGAAEVPPTVSVGVGSVSVTYDGTSALNIQLNFSGLTTSASAAHIHCCITSPGTNAAVAVPMPAFPPATAGAYSHSFALDDPATYASAFLSAGGGTAAGAQAVLLAGMESGNAYFNIHNSVFPGGEIRARLVPTIFHNGFD